MRPSVTCRRRAGAFYHSVMASMGQWSAHLLHFSAAWTSRVQRSWRTTTTVPLTMWNTTWSRGPGGLCPAGPRRNCPGGIRTWPRKCRSRCIFPRRSACPGPAAERPQQLVQGLDEPGVIGFMQDGTVLRGQLPGQQRPRRSRRRSGRIGDNRCPAKIRLFRLSRPWAFALGNDVYPGW